MDLFHTGEAEDITILKKKKRKKISQTASIYFLAQPLSTQANRTALVHNFYKTHLKSSSTFSRFISPLLLSDRPIRVVLLIFPDLHLEEETICQGVASSVRNNVMSAPLSEEKTRISVLGGGAWGTSLALQCARKGHDVMIWAREQEVVESINRSHENNVFLKGFELPENIVASSSGKEVVAHGELILIVVPTPFMERVMAPLAESITDEQILVSCTKGILNETLETPDRILKRVLPTRLHSRLAFLSGPSFAVEVAQGKPTAVTIACENNEVALRAQELLSSPRFRIYTSNDVIGVELGGALKNVLAIACGISDGLGFGNNGRAALITRGLDELTRLAVKCGANPLTLSGLSGVGDIILTCTGDLSRNRTVGMRLGKGEKLEDIVADMTAVAEGVLTSRSAAKLAEKEGIECPVIMGIYQVIHENADPAQVVQKNMSRPLIPEINPIVASKVQMLP